MLFHETKIDGRRYRYSDKRNSQSLNPLMIEFFSETLGEWRTLRNHSRWFQICDIAIEDLLDECDDIIAGRA